MLLYMIFWLPIFMSKYRKYMSIFLIIGVPQDSFKIYMKNRKYRSAGFPVTCGILLPRLVQRYVLEY